MPVYLWQHKSPGKEIVSVFKLSLLCGVYIVDNSRVVFWRDPLCPWCGNLAESTSSVNAVWMKRPWGYRPSSRARPNYLPSVNNLSSGCSNYTRINTGDSSLTAEGDLCGQNFCESPVGPESKCSSREVPADLTDGRCDASRHICSKNVF